MNWLEEAEWQKLVGQFKLHVGDTLSVFNLHGLGVFIPGAVDEITELMVDATQKARGADKPYSKKVRIPRKGDI